MASAVDVHGGTVWTMIWWGFKLSLKFVSNLILTRLLFPDVFGIMALVGVIVGAIGAAVTLAALQLWPPQIAVLLGMAATRLIIWHSRLMAPEQPTKPSMPPASIGPTITHDRNEQRFATASRPRAPPTDLA